MNEVYQESISLSVLRLSFSLSFAGKTCTSLLKKRSCHRHFYICFDSFCSTHQYEEKFFVTEMLLLQKIRVFSKMLKMKLNP